MVSTTSSPGCIDRALAAIVMESAGLAVPAIPNAETQANARTHRMIPSYAGRYLFPLSQAVLTKGRDTSSNLSR